MDLKNVNWDKLEEAKAIISYIKRHWARGQLTMVKFLGLSGLGKSYASMRTAELLAKQIHGDNYKITKRNIIKNLLQLIKFIRETNQSGEIMVIEEMSVLFPSRRAMSGINVDANAIIDTVRKKGIIMLCNYPLNKTVDSHIEAMCCLQIVTIQLNKVLGICLAYPLRLQTNPMIPKTYYHKLTNEDGDDVDYIFFRKPSDDLVKPYEQEKDMLMNDLYDKLEKKEEKRIEKFDKEYKSKKIELIKTPTQKEMDTWNEIKIKKRNIKELSKERGVTIWSIYKLLKNFQQKTKISLEKEGFGGKK